MRPRAPVSVKTSASSMIALARQRAEQRRSVALVHDDVRHALGDHRVEELDRRVTIGVWRQQLSPTSTVSGGNGRSRSPEGGTWIDRSSSLWPAAGCRASMEDAPRRIKQSNRTRFNSIVLTRSRHASPDSAAEPRQIRRQVTAHGLSDFEPTQHQHRQVVAEPRIPPVPLHCIKDSLSDTRGGGLWKRPGV